jgi:hypothetical protein
MILCKISSYEGGFAGDSVFRGCCSVDLCIVTDYSHDPNVFICRLNQYTTSLLGLLNPNAEGYMVIRNASKYK